MGASRADLPEIDFSTSLKVRFTGLVSRPSIGFSGGDAVNLGEPAWPKLLQHFDFDQISQALGETLPPVLIQVVRSDEHTQELDEVPLFSDNWQPIAFGPERHYGYAFQWFAMFLALTCLYFILNSRKM